MAVIAGVIALNKGVPKNLKSILSKSKLDNYGGRLTLLENKNKIKIIADYAHEKYSLVEIANLTRSLVEKDKKIIGVVRLAYDRSDELIKDTGRFISRHYDHLIVYDKIDGYFRKPKKLTKSKFPQEIGRVSKIFADAIFKKIKTVKDLSEKMSLSGTLQK